MCKTMAESVDSNSAKEVNSDVKCEDKHKHVSHDTVKDNANKCKSSVNYFVNNSFRNSTLLEEIINEKKLSLMQSPNVLKFLRENRKMNALSQRSGVTQLEFHQAMNDFKTMFPEMDADVIEVVLRANNGAVDATIDQLLAMNMDSENERLRAELEANDNNEVPPRYSPATPPPSYQQAVPCISSPNKAINSNNVDLTKCSSMARNALSTDSMRYKLKWNPPLLGHLPQTFLRIEPDENQRKLASTIDRNQINKNQMTSLNSAMLQQKMEENQRQRQLSFSSDDPELTQFLEDERVAIFLQNEEFVRELRRNKDFMSTLQLDTTGDISNGNFDGSSSDGPAMTSSHSDSDAAFKETLKHMGKVSRRKFAQLARLFSGRKRRSFQHLLNSENSNPMRDNLIIREDEYTQLQNEGSDNEDVRDHQFEHRSETDSQMTSNEMNKESSNTSHRFVHKN